MNKLVKKFLEKQLGNISWGSLRVNFQNNYEKVFNGSQSGLTSDIYIKDDTAIKDVLFRGELGFAEGYINDKWETSDLNNLLKILLKNQYINKNEIKPNFFVKILEKINFLLKKNSLSQAKKNIEFHYDLGNNFYSKWLDQTMSYSSAIYADDAQNLMGAQQNKYNTIINNLQINNSHKVCEIGCGWGGFVKNLTEKFHNIDINAYTISKSQYDFVSENVLPDIQSKNTSLNFMDYRKIDKKFDKIISIEMFEAVGKKYWDTYFEKIHSSLNENGEACLQIISINDGSFKSYLNNVDFIQKYIFPGGMLPSKSVLYSLFKKHNFELVRQIDFGKDYCKTLMEWKKRFNDNWGNIKNEKFNDRFRRVWNYYFDYCETGFALNHTDVSQFYLKKIA